MNVPLKYSLLSIGLAAGALGCSGPPPVDPDLLRCRFSLDENPTPLQNDRYLVGSIEVSRSDTGEVRQTIPVSFSEPSAETLAYGLRRDDMNFDGYPDVGVLEHGGSKWGYLHWWIYDEASGRFEWTALSDDLYDLTPGAYDVDVENRRLVVRTFRGAALETCTYRVCEGHLQLVDGPHDAP